MHERSWAAWSSIGLSNSPGIPGDWAEKRRSACSAGGSVAPFPACYKVRDEGRLSRQRAQGTIRSTVAVFANARAGWRALVASASDVESPVTTTQYPRGRQA